MKSAREFFEEVRRAAKNMERAELELACLAELYSANIQRYDAIGGHNSGVPTSLQDRYLLARERVSEEIDYYKELVNEGVMLANKVTSILGSNCYEYVLLHYYCDGWSWQRTADRFFVSVRTAQRWANVALDVIDGLGDAHIKAERGIAED